MKKHILYRLFLSVFPLIWLSMLTLCSHSLRAQDADEEVVKKNKARISLGFHNQNNTSPRLVASVKTKVDRSYTPVIGERIYFYYEDITDSTRLGNALSDQNGKATLTIPDTFTASLRGPILFLAAIENSDRFFDKDTDAEVVWAESSLKLVTEDSIQKVQFFVGEPDSTGEIRPVSDLSARIYVKRMFGLLPVSKDFETTNSEGILEIDFPDDIPGDEDGNLTIVAKLDDHDLYGSLTHAKKVDWGVPLVINAKENKRSLWAARVNAPVPLVIIVNTMLVMIWGTLVYIVLQVFKIKNAS